MKYPAKCYVLILVVTIGATILRVPKLELRPMHGDEAIHAKKLGALLEENNYRYDPHEYHGPTLNYFTLIPAWLSNTHNFADLNEFTLRIVPVFFGVLLVVLLLLVTDGLGFPATIIAAILTAVSSAFVFYSRYYIQEMLLVCFTFGTIASGWRYAQNKNIAWALCAAVFLGLMHATKETSIIAFGSMLLALLLILAQKAWQPDRSTPTGAVKILKSWHIVVALLVAVIVSALFCSSFLTNPTGIADSLRAYIPYLSRANQNQLHQHPWYYYLKMLIYSKYGTGPIWTEGLIVLLAAVGFIVAITKRNIAAANPSLLRFVAFYTLIMAVVYSVIPYKTPWCLLSFLHGMILLAGVGAVTIVKLTKPVIPRIVIVLLLVIATAHLAWQAYQGSFKFYADPRNPYVYAHPAEDVIAIAQRVKDISNTHPNSHNIPVHVICPDQDYWPLPWYMRSLTNVGWYSNIEDVISPAPVIILSASLEPALAKLLYEQQPEGQTHLYMTLFDRYMELRPSVELQGYIRNDLWQRLQEHNTDSAGITR